MLKLINYSLISFIHSFVYQNNGNVLNGIKASREQINTSEAYCPKSDKCEAMQGGPPNRKSAKSPRRGPPSRVSLNNSRAPFCRYTKE